MVKLGISNFVSAVQLEQSVLWKRLVEQITASIIRQPESALKPEGISMAGFGLPGCCLQAVGSKLCISASVGPPMRSNLKKANLEGKNRV